MLLRLIVIFVSLSFGASVTADVLGVYGGIGSWKSNFDGDVISSVDIDKELDISSDTGVHIYAGLEHPIPLLPNIKVARTNIKDSGTGTLRSSFEFRGETFVVDQTVATRVDLTHTDFTFYYQVVDTGMDVDIGVTARWFHGEVQVDSTKEDVDAVLPMLYARGKFPLPFTGFYVGGDANWISYSGNRVTDFAVKLGWETRSFIFPNFGIEVGYRKFSLVGDADDTDVDIDLDLDGVFVNLTAHF